MAKTIKEIYKDLKEWQNENPEERSIIAIVGYEGEKISLAIEGKEERLVESVATELIKVKELSYIITESIRMALRYENEEEDN